MSDNGQVFTDLIKHLQRDRVVKLFTALDKRFAGQHLKDLVVDEMGDHREMVVAGRRMVNFGCDSFLGLDRDPRVQNAIIDAVRKWGTFSGASRAFYSIAACEQVEAKLAQWLGVEATLLYPSTTVANYGAVPGLVQPGDLLVIDRLGHNSLHEASRFAQAAGIPVVELDPCTAEALEKLLDKHRYERCVVAVDGVYSMFGTTPPLRELNEVVRRRRGVLYVDDAHGTGVCGPKGRGAAYKTLGSLDDVIVAGSLSKGFSCAGAFVTCTQALKFCLKVKSNTYVFSGPIPSPYLDAISTVVEILMSGEYEVLAGRLHGLIERFSQGARQLGLPVIGGELPIVSILVRDAERTMQAGRWLFEHGYYVQSVAYPAVPAHEALLRVQVNANHTPQQIDGLLSALGELKKVIPFPSSEAALSE
jgi:glycine C-acetyltransferase